MLLIQVVWLRKKGRMPMPLDVMVEYTDGTKESFHAFQNTLMRWKNQVYAELGKCFEKGWDWAYLLLLKLVKPKDKIKSITIDPDSLMADINREDNIFLKIKLKRL